MDNVTIGEAVMVWVVLILIGAVVAVWMDKGADDE